MCGEVAGDRSSAHGHTTTCGLRVGAHGRAGYGASPRGNSSGAEGHRGSPIRPGSIEPEAACARTDRYSPISGGDGPVVRMNATDPFAGGVANGNRVDAGGNNTAALENGAGGALGSRLTCAVCPWGAAVGVASIHRSAGGALAARAAIAGVPHQDRALACHDGAAIAPSAARAPLAAISSIAASGTRCRGAADAAGAALPPWPALATGPASAAGGVVHSIGGEHLEGIGVNGITNSGGSPIPPVPCCTGGAPVASGAAAEGTGAQARIEITHRVATSAADATGAADAAIARYPTKAAQRVAVVGSVDAGVGSSVTPVAAVTTVAAIAGDPAQAGPVAAIAAIAAIATGVAVHIRPRGATLASGTAAAAAVGGSRSPCGSILATGLCWNRGLASDGGGDHHSGEKSAGVQGSTR